ncbi:cytochrome c biogenesis protein ResB [Desulfofalx alkaliphila]|uniref:cytochrome c biogenesis protein ResB n=1 Tax=Desulfofalx alkaliphila TaxID=105483 RepID=UPI0004E1FAAA|nr:cytochrome c biogenesis protein ResB [Desulfofalx alkaliphila]
MTQKNEQNKGRIGVIKLLSSMKTCIIILFLLGAISSLGSLIPQGQTGEFYTAHYGHLLGSFILLLSLNKLYSAWWFIALGLVFCASVIVCSVQRAKKIMGCRGYGSIILHLSMVVIIVGAFVSMAAGHSQYMEIGEGDTVNLAEKGFSVDALTVHQFEIDYYENLEPRQYRSEITLYTGDGKIEEEISVNHPLKHNGLKIYQNSYGWMLRGEVITGDQVIPYDLVNGSEIPLNDHTVLKMLFIPDYDEQGQRLHSKSPIDNNPTLACGLIHHDELIDVLLIPAGEARDFMGYTIGFEQYRYYTGLEIKEDYGVQIVFIGFIAMLAGFALRYLTPPKGAGRGERQ